MPRFFPKTLATANNVRFFNWPGAGEKISENLGFTHACVIPPGASIIHVGGQAGIAADGTVPKDIEKEMIEAFDHIELSLREAGLTGSRHDVWGCVYKINTYHANFNVHSSPALIKVMKMFLGDNRPLFTGVDVANLLLPEVHLEIEVQAFLPAAK